MCTYIHTGGQADGHVDDIDSEISRQTDVVYKKGPTDRQTETDK